MKTGIHFIAKIAHPFFVLLDGLTPVIALIARCWIGYTFLKSGLLKLANWNLTIGLFAYEFKTPFLSPEVAAILGTTAEITLPIFLILGFGSRLMIVVFFLFNLMTAISYPALWKPEGFAGLVQHVNWGIILGLLMCYGYGALSLDRLLQFLYNRKNFKTI